MKINAVEIVNVLIVIFLLFTLTRRRDVMTLLLVLFIYGTLHFSFAAVALATNGSVELLRALHAKGGGVLAKLSALSLLGVIFVLLSRQAFDSWVMKPWSKMKVELYILVVMPAVFCGYIFNIRQGDWLQFKNVVSIESMLALLLIGYVALAGVRTYNVNSTYSYYMSGLVILLVADCIAFYELFYTETIAGTVLTSGERIDRVCSILFNPNLFAFLASLLYLGFAYGMHAYEKHRKMMLWGMALASIAVYLSGSRSAGLLLMGMLFISLLLMKERLRWVSSMVLPLTMLIIYVVAKWLVIPFVSSNEGWRKIALLGERFAVAPLNLANYALMKAGVYGGGHGGGHGGFLGGFLERLEGVNGGETTANLLLSIEGRFVGEGRDAGWFVLYHDVGWFGTAAAILGACMLVARGVQVYRAYPSPSSVYALITLLYCLMTGFGMQFQIFPVWLFIGVILTLCLVFWSRTAASNPLPTSDECAH